MRLLAMLLLLSSVSSAASFFNKPFACSAKGEAKEFIQRGDGRWQLLRVKEETGNQPGADIVSRAQVKQGRFTWTKIETDVAGDMVKYTDLCFDQSGRLLHYRHEFRTAWGWGYAEEGAAFPRKLKSTATFFETRNNKEIARPQDGITPEEVEEAGSPVIYRRLQDLPFYALLQVEGHAGATVAK